MRKRGSESTGRSKATPNSRDISEGGRELTLIGWLNKAPKVRKVRECGRESTGWLKHPPNVRWVRECGRKSTGWLKQSPKVRCVSESGSKLIGWLKCLPNSRCVSEEGREPICLLNFVEKLIRVTYDGGGVDERE